MPMPKSSRRARLRCSLVGRLGAQTLRAMDEKKPKKIRREARKSPRLETQMFRKGACSLEPKCFVRAHGWRLKCFEQ